MSYKNLHKHYKDAAIKMLLDGAGHTEVMDTFHGQVGIQKALVNELFEECNGKLMATVKELAEPSKDQDGQAIYPTAKELSDYLISEDYQEGTNLKFTANGAKLYADLALEALKAPTTKPEVLEQ